MSLPTEHRIGLGCMRLSTDPDRDDGRGRATIRAALAAGVVLFDTAHAYGHDDADAGHNERLLASVVREAGADPDVRIVTKGGMTRPGGAWQPDGRAGTLRRHCEASLAALDGLPIDCYLLHAPDPRVSWATSVRALGRLLDAGLVRRIGLSNVTLAQLDAALDLAPIGAVQVALGLGDDTPLRNGVLQRCAAHGIPLLAHSPLGGPRRAARLLADPVLTAATPAGTSPARTALAWLTGLDPVVIPIPGARRPETAAALGAVPALDDEARAALDRRFGRPIPLRRNRPRAPEPPEIVMVMGVPGAGKTRLAHRLAAERNVLRLNRDERGGTLRALAADLDDALTAGLPDGVRTVVLDNTYLTRAARSHVVDVAARHGATLRCCWLDTPAEAARVNVVLRLLEVFGHLPTPEELTAAARTTPGLHTPTSHLRTLRELEPPTAQEGLTAVERIPFERRNAVAPVVVAVHADVLAEPDWPQRLTAHRDLPHLLFGWRPGADGVPPDLVEAAARLGAVVTGPVEVAHCPHPGGPPRCWCRPPLPGLPLAFAHRHGTGPAGLVRVDPRL